MLDEQLIKKAKRLRRAGAIRLLRDEFSWECSLIENIEDLVKCMNEASQCRSSGSPGRYVMRLLSLLNRGAPPLAPPLAPPHARRPYRFMEMGMFSTPPFSVNCNCMGLLHAGL